MDVLRIFSNYEVTKTKITENASQFVRKYLKYNKQRNYPANIYLFKVNRKFGKKREICSKLTIKTPERHH